MSVRIYQLAKEFEFDSKEFLEICAKAGVTGKGSALASLTDDEESKVRGYIAGGVGKTGGRTAAAGGAKGGTATLPPPPTSAPISREAYIPPAGTLGKPPVLPGKPAPVAKPERVERPAAAEAPKKPPEGPKAPVIRVAPLPTAQQPPPPTKPAEPAPQKPVIKLPADVRSGRAPLARQVQAAAEKSLEATPKAPSKKPGGPRPAGGGAETLPAAPTSPRPRRGTAKPAAAEDVGMGTREDRQKLRKRAATDRPLRIGAGGVVEEERTFRRPKPRQKRAGVSTAAPRKGHVIIQLPCTVRSFSASIGVPVPKVLGKLLQLGTVSNITSELEAETIELLAVEFGAEVEVRQAYDIESHLISAIQAEQDTEEQLEPRPPIVTFLGHVDHGKTSLLDRIIGTNVAAGESGGITQHIRAYRIEREGRSIAFVDTPGHEAFTQMRARGANVTDIAVLVVAADDGVMPQTEEAISHARAANVPIVVALNKIDLHGTNIDRIMQQLAANELLPADWGGTTEVVKCSALTGQGVDDLLETLLTIAELHEYKANPQRHAYGTCLESEVNEERGVVAKLLVQNGTLNVGDVLVCGSAYGRVKAMYDTLNPRLTHETAPPSTPVNVTGLDQAPGAGEHFYVLHEISDARGIAEQRGTQSRRLALSKQTAHVTLENLHERLGGDEVQTLNIILRADTQGSIEAIMKEFGKLQHPEVQLKILQKMVGGITEADVHLADASDAVIIGFNVVPDEGARGLADDFGVQIRRYDIIYQVTDDIKKALEGMLKPEKRDIDVGRALVQRTFLISRLGTIAGCRVLSGNIERNSRIRVIRDSRVLGDYPLESLKREKDDAREVREGLECGIKLRGYNDLKEGDILECYRVEEFARTL